MLSCPLDPNLLVADILLVRLQNDISIDVGWYPEDDPEGEFRIRVYRRGWENQLLPQPITTTDPREVVREVNRLAAKYSGVSTASISWSPPGVKVSKMTTTRSVSTSNEAASEFQYA